MYYSEKSLKPVNETEVIIVGGGPAGLSCALLLGRCRRNVIVFDEGHPRNRNALKMHGFISRDGFPPLKFLDIARDEIQKYDVSIIQKKVINVEKTDHSFMVYSEDGSMYRCEKLVLATGISDILPEIPEIEQFFGISIFHCPYCDAFEFSGKKIAVMGNANNGLRLALNLINWSPDVYLLCNGDKDLTEKEKKRFNYLGIGYYEGRVIKLEGKDGILKNVILENEIQVDCDALFISYGHVQNSDIPAKLGCEFNKAGVVKTNSLQETNIPGFYVIGDASRDMQLVIVAASEGTKAGVAIHTSLMKGK